MGEFITCLISERGIRHSVTRTNYSASALLQAASSVLSLLPPSPPSLLSIQNRKKIWQICRTSAQKKMEIITCTSPYNPNPLLWLWSWQKRYWQEQIKTDNFHNLSSKNFFTMPPAWKVVVPPKARPVFSPSEQSSTFLLHSADPVNKSSVTIWGFWCPKLHALWSWFVWNSPSIEQKLFHAQKEIKNSFPRTVF